MEGQPVKGQVYSADHPMKKIFFYEKPNGTIFEVDELNAWKIHKHFKQIGVSDGRFYSEAIVKLRADAAAKKAAGTSMTTEEMNLELRKAYDKELEAARGNLETPRDFSVETFGNSKLQGFIKTRG